MNSELLHDFQLSVNVPPRSRLFFLAPGGAGTPDQEGLLSLLVRTCHAHAVNPRLVIRDILPEAESGISRIPTAAFYQRLAGTMNGLGKYAELFVSAMEKLTGRTDLRILTMLPWQDLFPHNGQGMLARHRRWCPACMHGQYMLGEEINLPLLWSLETYSFCRHHRVPLEHICPSCGKTQPFVPAYPDLGICSHCRRPLWGIRTPKELSGFQSWIADALAGMVERQAIDGFAPLLKTFRAFLTCQVQAHTDGNRAAFCRALGLNEFATSGWLNKGERPSITHFLTICYGTKTMPWEVFRNRQLPASFTSRCSPAEKIRARSPNPRPDSDQKTALRKALQNYLDTGHGQSVAAIANQIGVSKTCLRYWFPDLCESLSARSRATAQRKSETRRKEQQHTLKSTIRKITKSGGHVSYRRIAKSLRPGSATLSEEHLRNAYRDEINAMHK